MERVQRVRILFFFKCYGDHRDLHSFPTRRSSDLLTGRAGPCSRSSSRRSSRWASSRSARRSEEHTSELQSHSDLVCRLLLEKKKKITRIDPINSKLPMIDATTEQRVTSAENILGN